MARELRNRLVYDNAEDSLRRHVPKYIKGRLLDIGCGTKPYREMLAPFVSEHVGVDHEASSHDRSNVDLNGTAYEIPVPDAAFDSALCTFVLEHLEEPEQALCECYRILKPGAHALYQAPFIWHLHEDPRDFYRYSRYGLEHLFRKVGFEIVELEALSGFWLTFGQLFVYHMYRYNRGPLRWFRITDGLAILLQRIFYGLDRLDKSEDWTYGYTVVARKPAEAPPMSD